MKIESTSHISGHEVEGLETLGISTMENLSLSINPEFGKHFGNPSSSETDTTSSESDSDSSENSSDFDESFPETEQNLEFSIKSYDFWPTLATRILQKKVKDQISILRPVPVPEDHPNNIAPSIALKLIPKTSDLVQRAQSRFVTEQTNKDAILGVGQSTS
ncbi:Hypothetical predicted protein [Paramuricea clavata]|uniref:Uncharacterized protein n=1 Tax=Paramuricea clavata TaxID=317549 RepID=A0A7D9K5U7_PARCT|nr:Hypothetical predicted protein [Paramuricea clavata]